MSNFKPIHAGEVARRLADTDPGVREQAARDVSRLGSVPDELLDRLFDRLADTTAAVVRAAMSALRTLGEEDRMAFHLSEMAKSPDPAIRRRVIAAVQWAAGDGGYDPVCLLEVAETAAEHGAKAADDRAISAAVEALAALGTPALEPLTRFLSSRHERLAAEACFALARFGPGAACAVRPLIGLTLRPRSAANYAALQALKAVGPAAQEAVPTLVSRLGAGDFSDEDIDTLAAIGPAARAAVPSLMKLLVGMRPDQDYHDELLSSVAAALRAIGHEHMADHPELAAEIAPALLDGYFGGWADYEDYEGVLGAVAAVCRVPAAAAVPLLLARVHAADGIPPRATGSLTDLLESLGVTAVPVMLAWAAASPDGQHDREAAEAFVLSLGEDSRPALLMATNTSDRAMAALAGQLLAAVDEAARTAEHEEHLTGRPSFLATERTPSVSGLDRAGYEAYSLIGQLEIFYWIGAVCRKRGTRFFSFTGLEAVLSKLVTRSDSLSAASIGRHIEHVSEFFHSYYKRFEGINVPSDDDRMVADEDKFVARYKGRRPMIGAVGWKAWEETKRYLTGQGIALKPIPKDC